MKNTILELKPRLVLNFRKWIYGNPSENDDLYSSGDDYRELVSRSTGRMDALGMFMIQAGMTKEELTGKAGVCHAKIDILTLKGDGMDFAAKLVCINDDFSKATRIRRTVEEKIEAIRALAKEYGHSLRVVGLPKIKIEDELQHA